MRPSSSFVLPNLANARRAAATAALVLSAAGAAAGCVKGPSSVERVPLSHAGIESVPAPPRAEVFPHCPLSVAGARSAIEDVDGGVAIDVRGDDDATIAAIRGSTLSLLAIVGEGKTTIRHTGEGDGPGLGRCPVVLHDAVIVATPIADGARIFVRTKPDEAEWLRREARARMTELHLPTTTTGVGMDHCPSALPSAATEVRDLDDGVAVTVLSRDPEVTAAIRARAWHLAQESRRVGVHAEHAPPAKGARPCPVVMRDTRVEAHEVPGGAEIAVHARLLGEAEHLRREARARADAFR